MSASKEFIFKDVNLKIIDYREKRDLKVTKSGSKYSDNIWSFVNDILQSNLKTSNAQINWKVDLFNDRFLTDPEFIKLLETSKDFILSLISGQNSKAKINKPTTAIKAFKSLVPLLRWMVSESIDDFSVLDSNSTERYKTYLKLSESKYAKPLSDGEIFKRLDVINQIWKSNEYISNPIPTNPYPGENPFQLSGIEKGKLSKSKFDFIPDDIALALGTIATDYIQNRSIRILAAKKAVEEMYSEKLKTRSESVAEKESRRVANAFGYKYVKDVNREVGYLRTACYIAVAMFTGIRDSEIASLKINCVETNKVENYLWIHGFVFKTADTKIAAKWMAPPIVGNAIEVLVQLTSGLRNKLNSKISQLEIDVKQPITTGKKLDEINSKLLSYGNCKDALWLVEASKLGNEISTNKSIHEQLKEFIKNHDIPKHNGKDWGLHPHQFRRTFVKFMVKNSMNLIYLQEHFKHISLDMTAWYDIEDVTLSQEIADFYEELSGETLKSIINDKSLAGQGGKLISQKQEHYFQGMVEESKDKVIRKMASSVALRSTGVSWCMGDVENGECTGVHGCMIDPSNVNKCSQAIITKEFLPAWQHIKLDNEKLLKCDDLGVHQKGAVEKFIKTVVNPVIETLTA